MAEALQGWLALRESADAAARSDALVKRLTAAIGDARPVRILDLGSGTGSNIRYLAPRLPHPQEWLAVDRDPALLAMSPLGVRTLALELGPLDWSLFADRRLVTASALLDLVSASWIERLASACARVGAAVLFALNYDGRSDCEPREPEDDAILALFNQHQRSNDKGFGPAAGPDAAACAAECLSRAGYEILSERTDWLLAPDSRELQRDLIRGWATAASEVAADRADAIGSWLRRRLQHVDHGVSRIRVGHVDVAAWPK